MTYSSLKQRHLRGKSERAHKAHSEHCGHPQPILLIHKGLLDSTSKPLFFLGKIWERNHFSRVNLRPSSAEKFTKFFCRVPFIIGESVRVIVRHTAAAVTQTLLTNLLGYAQGVHCGGICVAKRVQT